MDDIDFDHTYGFMILKLSKCIVAYIVHCTFELHVFTINKICRMIDC